MTGSFTKLDKPKTIVQNWRLSQWVKDHYATLTINFDQNDIDGVTIMRVQFDKVPIGQEDVVRRNWGEYYVKTIKTTFGFGTIL